MIKLTKEEVAVLLNKFVWGYKVGDNISYNFKQLFYLYEQRESKTKIEEKNLYNKHISITIVSIIEAVLYDFIVRLSEATNHFPTSLSEEEKNNIKRDIDKDKITIKSGKYEYKRVKNYSNKELKAILEKHSLLGNKSTSIYKEFEEACFLRNRIHIFNWFGNFEPDEEFVFSDDRLKKIEDLLVKIITYLSNNYSRPTDSNQTNFWLDKISLHNETEFDF